MGVERECYGVGRMGWDVLRARKRSSERMETAFRRRTITGENKRLVYKMELCV